MAEASKEGLGSKRAVVPMMIMMKLIITAGLPSYCAL